MNRIIPVVAGLAVVAAAGAFFVLRSDSGDRFAECRTTAIAGGTASIGGPFELTNQNGERVTDADVIDRPSLVYFGYTFCPDVCPQDTYRNAEVAALLDERGIDVKPVMITIDPARDTPEAMKAFVEYLSEKMVGLTGTEAEIADAARAYRVYYAKNGSGEDYLMDHSTMTYLMAPEYGFLEFFRREETEEQIADRVQCFVEKL